MRKILLYFLLLVVFFIAIFFINSIDSKSVLKSEVFTLSCSQVYESLKDTQPKCTRLENCNLSEGDILIRSYITPRTRLFVYFFKPYFTHSAIYLGKNQLAEAVGNEKNPEDEIRINNFSKSTWLNADMINFVVIRPKENTERVNKVIERVKDIANDPDYVFGLATKGEKRTSCAELIFNALLEEGMIENKSSEYIVTPDYLFWIMIQNKDKFEIIGYSIEC